MGLGFFYCVYDFKKIQDLGYLVYSSVTQSVANLKVLDIEYHAVVLNSFLVSAQAVGIGPSPKGTCRTYKLWPTWNVLSTGTYHFWKCVWGGRGLGKQIKLSFPIIFNTVPKLFGGGQFVKKKLGKNKKAAWKKNAMCMMNKMIMSYGP